MNNALFNYGLMYSENSLEHLARQTARRYCEKQYSASGNRKSKTYTATPSKVWQNIETAETTAQSGGLLFWKQLSDDIARYNALYKDNGETVKTAVKVESGEIEQSVDMETTKALENASIDNSTAVDFVSECFACMLSAYRQLEQFAERNKIILTAEQCRLYLIKQGAKGCYKIQKQEFPRHKQNGKNSFVYITDINEQADILTAVDDYEQLFNNAVLADLFSILNAREQLVITEHYVKGYSYKAIAEQHTDFFKNGNAVRVSCQRIIAKMQEYAKAHKITA